jgi:hypothetical protein
VEKKLYVDQTTSKRTIVFIRIYCHWFITIVMINTIIVGKKLPARVLKIYIHRKKYLLHMTSVKLAFVLPPCSAVNRVPQAIKRIVTERREKSERERERERGFLITLFLFVTEKKCSSTSSHVPQI